MKKQRILSALLALCLVLSLAPAALAAGADGFTDVGRDSWCYEYVDYVTSRGYFLGTTDTTFSPDRNMTRAMFVVVLSRFDDVEVDNSRSSFSDVEAGSWCTGAIEWAAENGIVTGYADGTFRPNASITRAQMCAIMDRYLNYYTAKHSVTVARNGSAATLADQSQVPSYAASAVRNCQIYGLINGYSDGTFRPNTNSTRAHVAAIIYRLAFLVENAEPIKKASSGTSASSGKNPSHPDKDEDDGEYVYTLTYKSADGSKTYKTVSSGKTTETSWSFAPYTPADANEEGEFLGWSTVPNGDVYYPAGNRIILSKSNASKTLYAVWGDGDDLIGNAVAAAIGQAGTEYIDKVNDKIAEVSGKVDGTASASIEFTYSDEIDENGARPQTLTLTANVTDDAAIEVIDQAVQLALVLVNDGKDAAVDDAKGDADTIVEWVKDAIEEITGIEITDDKSLEEIKAEAQKALVDAGKSLWVNFYDENGNYYTGDVTIEVNGYSVTVSVDQENHTTTLNGVSKTDAVKGVAEAIAKELYADLKENTDYVSAVKLDSVITVTFSANEAYEEYAEKTAAHPYVYPVTVVLNLTSDGLVQYKYDGEDYLAIAVSEDLKAAYKNAIDEVAQNIILNDPDIQGKLKEVVEDALNDNIDGILDSLTSKIEAYEIDLEVDEETIQSALLGAVDDWLKDNIAQLYAALDSGEIADLDNSALSEAVWTSVEDSFPQDQDEMAEWVEKVVEKKAADVDIVAKLQSSTYAKLLELLGYDVESIDDVNALLDIVIMVEGKQITGEELVYTLAEDELDKKFVGSDYEDIYNELSQTTKDYLIYTALVSKGLNFEDAQAETEDAALKELLNKLPEVIKDYIDEQISTEVAKIDISDILGDLEDEENEYQKYLELKDQLDALKSGAIKDKSFSALANLLRNETLQSKVGSTGDSYVQKYLSRVIGLIPESASITVGSVTIGKTDLDDLKKANTTVEVMDALADLLGTEGLGTLTLADFSEAEGGVPVAVTYNGRTFTFHLVIDESANLK